MSLKEKLLKKMIPKSMGGPGMFSFYKACAENHVCEMCAMDRHLPDPNSAFDKLKDGCTGFTKKGNPCSCKANGHIYPDAVLAVLKEEEDGETEN